MQGSNNNKDIKLDNINSDDSEQMIKRIINLDDMNKNYKIKEEEKYPNDDLDDVKNLKKAEEKTPFATLADEISVEFKILRSRQVKGYGEQTLKKSLASLMAERVVGGESPDSLGSEEKAYVGKLDKEFISVLCNIEEMKSNNQLSLKNLHDLLIDHTINVGNQATPLIDQAIIDGSEKKRPKGASKALKALENAIFDPLPRQIRLGSKKEYELNKKLIELVTESATQRVEVETLKRKNFGEPQKKQVRQLVIKYVNSLKTAIKNKDFNLKEKDIFCLCKPFAKLIIKSNQRLQEMPLIRDIVNLLFLKPGKIELTAQESFEKIIRGIATNQVLKWDLKPNVKRSQLIDGIVRDIKGDVRAIKYFSGCETECIKRIQNVLSQTKNQYSEEINNNISGIVISDEYKKRLKDELAKAYSKFFSREKAERSEIYAGWLKDYDKKDDTYYEKIENKDNFCLKHAGLTFKGLQNLKVEDRWTKKDRLLCVWDAEQEKFTVYPGNEEEAEKAAVRIIAHYGRKVPIYLRGGSAYEQGLLRDALLKLGALAVCDKNTYTKKTKNLSKAREQYLEDITLQEIEVGKNENKSDKKDNKGAIKALTYDQKVVLTYLMAKAKSDFLSSQQQELDLDENDPFRSPNRKEKKAYKNLAEDIFQNMSAKQQLILATLNQPGNAVLEVSDIKIHDIPDPNGGASLKKEVVAWFGKEHNPLYPIEWMRSEIDEAANFDDDDALKENVKEILVKKITSVIDLHGFTHKSLLDKGPLRTIRRLGGKAINKIGNKFSRQERKTVNRGDLKKDRVEKEAVLGLKDEFIKNYVDKNKDKYENGLGACEKNALNEWKDVVQDILKNTGSMALSPEVSLILQHHQSKQSNSEYFMQNNQGLNNNDLDEKDNDDEENKIDNDNDNDNDIESSLSLFK